MNDYFNADTAPTEAVDLLHFVNAVAESITPTPESNDTQHVGNESSSESRARGARLIVPGFSCNNTLKNVLWPPGASKPTLPELRNEILVRNPTSKPKYYDKAKCIDILLKVPYLPPSGDSDQQRITGPNNVTIKMKYSKVRDAPRLTNAIIHLKEKCLVRDAKLTRVQIDNKESNDFWVTLSITYNDLTIAAMNTCLFPDNHIFEDLSFEPSGFVMNAGIAKAKYNDLKKLIDYALHNFRRSGNGDGGLKSSGATIGDAIDEVFEDESVDSLESFQNSPKKARKGVSKIESLTVYSSDFFSFANYNAILFYFYTAFIKYDLLESCASDMEDEHAGNSMECSSASHPKPTRISHEKGENDNDDKGPPLVKAARLLAASFTATVTNSPSTAEKNDGKKEKEEDHQNELTKAFERLEAAKRMFNEDDGTDLDIYEHKKTYLQQMKDKVGMLLEK